MKLKDKLRMLPFKAFLALAKFKRRVKACYSIFSHSHYFLVTKNEPFDFMQEIREKYPKQVLEYCNKVWTEEMIGDKKDEIESD